MSEFFGLLMFVSFCCLTVGLLKPSIFQKLSKKKMTHTKIFLYFSTATFLFMILIGATASTEQQKGTSLTKPEGVKTDITESNTEIKNYLQEKFNVSSKSTVSDVAINKNILFIKILPPDYLKGTLIDIALVLNRHPEVIFDEVNIKDGTYEFSFSKKSFDLFKKGEINDAQFSKNLELLSTNFEILTTNHNSTVENFHLVIKNAKPDEFVLQKFVDKFRNSTCKKDCNIQIYDNTAIKLLTTKYPLADKEYLEVADSFVAWSMFDSHEVWLYPFQDIKYKELGGKNWKKKPVNQ